MVCNNFKFGDGLLTCNFPSILYTVTNGSSTLPKRLSTPNLDHSPKIEIHVIWKQYVDEFHPTVQELVKEGYNVKQSIDAVKHHEGLEGARDYLRSAKSGEGFQVSTSDEGYRAREIELMLESRQGRTM